MMWPYYGGGLGWLWMGAMMIVFWGAIVLFAVWAFRSIAGSRSGDEAALATLRKRLAAGEITPDEFERTRRLLQG